jgi:Exocyst complex component Sec5
MKPDDEAILGRYEIFSKDKWIEEEGGVPAGVEGAGGLPKCIMPTESIASHPKCDPRSRDFDSDALLHELCKDASEADYKEVLVSLKKCLFAAKAAESALIKKNFSMFVQYRELLDEIGEELDGSGMGEIAKGLKSLDRVLSEFSGYVGRRVAPLLERFRETEKRKKKREFLKKNWKLADAPRILKRHLENEDYNAFVISYNEAREMYEGMKGSVFVTELWTKCWPVSVTFRNQIVESIERSKDIGEAMEKFYLYFAVEKREDLLGTVFGTLLTNTKKTFHDLLEKCIERTAKVVSPEKRSLDWGEGTDEVSSLFEKSLRFGQREGPSGGDMDSEISLFLDAPHYSESTVKWVCENLISMAEDAGDSLVFMTKSISAIEGGKNRTEIFVKNAFYCYFSTIITGIYTLHEKVGEVKAMDTFLVRGVKGAVGSALQKLSEETASLDLAETRVGALQKVLLSVLWRNTHKSLGPAIADGRYEEVLEGNISLSREVLAIFPTKEPYTERYLCRAVKKVLREAESMKRVEALKLAKRIRAEVLPCAVLLHNRYIGKESYITALIDAVAGEERSLSEAVVEWGEKVVSEASSQEEVLIFFVYLLAELGEGSRGMITVLGKRFSKDAVISHYLSSYVEGEVPGKNFSTKDRDKIDALRGQFSMLIGSGGKEGSRLDGDKRGSEESIDGLPKGD